MTMFRWQGRSRDGRQMSGEIDAPSKEEALELLRGQKLMITEIDTRSSGEPADPDRNVPRFTADRPKAPQGPRRFRALLIVAAFVLAGLAVRSVAPPWRESWVPLLLSSLLLLIGALLFAVVILSFFWRPKNLIAVFVVLLSVSAVNAQILLETPPPAPGKLVDIGGRKLHLNCKGSGTPTVIVENGSSSFSIDWALVQPEVAKRTRICTYDRAGFAWSDRGPTSDTVEETVDDLHLLLRAAAIRPPYVLVGASIGGMYVRAFQRRYPAEVAGLVLVDATPEEDLEYLVDGKSTPGVKMSYDQMEAVYAPLLKDPPPPVELPEAIEAPYDRLPKDLQTARLWAARRLAARNDMPHAWITAESWRQEFFALRKRRLEKLHALDDLPLVVLARGKGTNDVLRKREHDLVALSSIGKEVMATESDHEIFLYQPELVIKAIRDTVDAASHRRAR